MTPAMRLAVPLVGAALAGHAMARTRIGVPPARAGWFLCDAVNAPFAALAGTPRGGRGTIALLDRQSGRLATRSYAIGAGDPGMSQVHWPLSRGGRIVGDVHGVQAGVFDPGVATGIVVSEVTIGRHRLACRFVPRLRFIGLDARRTVTVSGDAGAFVYRSYDVAARGSARGDSGVAGADRPSSRIDGGTALADGRQGYRFARGGYVVTVARSAYGTDPGGVVVTRDGRVVGRDLLLASSVPVGPPPPATPPPATPPPATRPIG